MMQVVIGGAAGKVGRLLVEAVERDPEVRLVAEVVRLKSAKSETALANIQVPIDVFIDFSVPKAAMEHLAIAVERGYRLVMGVTGFTEGEKRQIALAARKIPIVFAPNMSLGVNVTYPLLATLASALGDRADVAILDIHHKAKKDAPSGTALQMAEVIHQAQGGKSEKTNIQFSSLRMADTVAEVTAIFALEGERIEITHRATNRAIFATGALTAAKWLLSQKAGLYDIQDVLGI